MRLTSAAMHGMLRAVAVTIVLAAPGCDSTAPLPSGEWQPMGLSSREVVLLREHDGVLYAGTKSGLFARPLASSDTTWTALGLADRRIMAVMPLGPASLIAGVYISGVGADTISLLRSDDGGAQWRPYQMGAGEGEGGNLITGLVRLPDGSLLASGVYTVLYRSVNDGDTWDDIAVGEEYGGIFQSFLHVDAWWPGTIWLFGETGFFQPFRAVSRDVGATWLMTRGGGGGDNAHYSLATHPSDPDRVYTGMEGRIMRSMDGGASWHTVYLPAGYDYLYGIAVSPSNPARIIAAGALNAPAQEQYLTLHVSDDGGSSWHVRARPDLPGGFLSMHLRQESGGEVLYLGTHSGVIRYRE